MSEEQEKQKIRDVIFTWIDATERGDLDTVLSLMAEDVVFLMPKLPPLRGRQTFASMSRANTGARIKSVPDIQEIHIAGDMAFCWNHLAITLTPKEGVSIGKEGHILSVFRKEPDGRWVLFRDANLFASL